MPHASVSGRVQTLQSHTQATAATAGGGVGGGVPWRAPASWRRLIENDAARALYA
jgi:hypothetical protein